MQGDIERHEAAVQRILKRLTKYCYSSVYEQYELNLVVKIKGFIKAWEEFVPGYLSESFKAELWNYTGFDTEPTELEMDELACELSEAVSEVHMELYGY